MRTLLLICACLLTGCGVDTPTGDDDPDPEIVDEDLDGFVASVDCDDDAITTFPGAAEQCDGIDNDCDGMADEDFDQDGDGHINPDTCFGVGDDCDDTDAGVYAGAEETCENVEQIDNDCNGDPYDWGDDDGDGYVGATAESGARCDADCDDSDPNVNPGAVEVCDGINNDCYGSTDEDKDSDGDGYTQCSGDCNEENHTTYPGAAEYCDGLDNNCDTFIDEGC